MENETESIQYDRHTNAFKTLLDTAYFHKLPSYGNKIFFGLGFLALTCFVLLAATGITMAFMGQHWWLFSPWGIYVRSIHLWSVQAFIAILLLHILVGLATSGFRAPRRMVWVFGATIFCLALIQTEFGYGLRGDFESQFRAVSGADFWNGAYFGYWLNPLNYTQSFVLHVAIIPFFILVLFMAHYLLEHTFGISKPYRSDVKYKMVPADHRIMYIRGVALVAAILVLAFFFLSPYVKQITIEDVAVNDPSLVANNLLSEFARTSDTATYLDSIDPYTFDTRQVYVAVPYEKLTEANGRDTDEWHVFMQSTPLQQALYIDDATNVLASSTAALATTSNPVVAMIDALMPATKNGTYQSILDGENPSTNYTYSTRFLSDMDVFEDKAGTLNMSTEQWGMVKDEGSRLLPPGSWWFLPLALSNSAFDLPDNPNGDRIAAEILGFIMLVFIAFPYIPFVNRFPEFLRLAPLIWRTKDE